MSGLSGIYHLDACETDYQEVARSLHCIAHRGPDHTGIWLEGPVGLGHQALHATPQSVGVHQPIEDLGSGIVLTADVRIDNRTDLIQALGWTARQASTIADATLILGAYKKWGQDCPAHLLGAFAFALWDPREHVLFCARDHMGVKPFYYFHSAGQLFTFGTEIKAVLAYPGVGRRINADRVADYLNRWGGDPETTFFEGVRRLPPAHSMVVRRDGAVTRRYWALDRHRELSFASDEAYVEGFREVFTEAVRCRLRSAQQPGVMLSGGLDSSSVACVARSLPGGPKPVPTFSATFPGLPSDKRAISDEEPYLDALQAQGGFAQCRVPLDEVSPLEGIDRVLRHLDQPPYINNLYLYGRLHQACKRAGVGALLDGAEGDDAVSYGVGYLSELAADRRWHSFSQEASALAGRVGRAPAAILHGYGGPKLQDEFQSGHWLQFARDIRTVSNSLDVSYHRLLWRYGLKPMLPDRVRRIRRRLSGLGGHDRDAAAPRTLASQELLEHTDFEGRLAHFNDRLGPMGDTARDGHWRVLHGGAGDIATVLEEVNGLAAMHGLEQRHPFYDVRVLSYCLALPPDQKLKEGWTRSILRRAMNGVLPDKIRTRVDKADLSPNFRRNLIRFGDEHLERLVEEAPSEWTDYVDAEAVRKAYRDDRIIDLWPVLVLSRWLKEQSRRRDTPMMDGDLRAAVKQFT